MGWQRLEESFRKPRTEGRVGLIPYLTVGFPALSATVELVQALEEAGADTVELGVPFSDPLADGATVQQANFHALQQGVTLGHCFEVCSTLRHRGVRVPLVLMGYYNPLLAYGLEEVARDGGESGVDGFIVVDLPPEEASPLHEVCVAQDLALVPLLAPTSTEARIKQACTDVRGFVYCVSLTGVTGARAALSSDVADLVTLVRRHTPLPLAVGFGISNREHVEALACYADAVVVGSALLDAIVAAPQGQRVAGARAFLAGLEGVCRPVGRGSR